MTSWHFDVAIRAYSIFNYLYISVLHSYSTIIYETIQILTLSAISILAPAASKCWTTFVCPSCEANISAV